MNTLNGTNRRFTLVFAFCLSFLVGLPESQAQEPYDQPYCTLVEPDVCDVEDFNSESLKKHDQSNQPYTTGQGFSFEVINGPGWLRVQEYNNLGHGLFFEPDTTRMDVPNPSEYVTFVFKGFSARINFIAVDTNGSVVDEATKENLDPNQGAEVVTLGTGTSAIATVYMHHTAFNSCEFDNMEPLLSEVRACNTRTR